MQVDHPTAGDAIARARITLTYLWRHGRLPDLRQPRRFTELVQLRKLVDRDPRLPALADKVAVKHFVGERLGREWVVPLLWSGDEVPLDLSWDQPVVVKARHGCGQTRIVPGGQTDWRPVAREARRWMTTTYGRWLDEWLYAHIPRGLLIEPFIGRDHTLPIDYKVYVFHGQASHVQVHLDRATDHRWVVHDRDWRPLTRAAPAVPRPSALAAMIAAAEELAQGLDFVRVDFYQPEAQPLFGEMTFYPGSGLDPFDPPTLDTELGALWLAGRRDDRPPAPEPLPIAA